MGLYYCPAKLSWYLPNIDVYTYSQMWLLALFIEAYFNNEEFYEFRDLWIPKMVRTSNIWVLSPKEVIFISPILRLKDHCRNEGRKSIRAGRHGERLWKTDFWVWHRQHSHNLTAAVAACRRLSTLTDSTPYL